MIGAGSRWTAGVIKGAPPPEYHTGCVYTELGEFEIWDKVELVAPATSPPVALVAPTGAVETLCSDSIGVVISGT
jgi:hypothetical protein